MQGQEQGDTTVTEKVKRDDARSVADDHRVRSIAALALFMCTVDGSIVSQRRCRRFTKSLRATINWAGWTITIYGLGSIIALPIAGGLSDQFGRRRLFISSVALFVVTSILCGASTNIYMLIVFRGLQALGGGAFIPSAAGLISDHFGRDRDRAIGMFGVIFSAGGIVGPVLGGVIVTFLSWRWIFFVNVPIGAVLFFLILQVYSRIGTQKT